MLSVAPGPTVVKALDGISALRATDDTGKNGRRLEADAI